MGTQVLLVYGTNSGGTLEVAEYVAETLRGKDVSVHVQNAWDAIVDDLERFDGIILGSCSWSRMSKDGEKQGQLQQDMGAFTLRAAKLHVPNKKFAVFGLGDHTYSSFCGSATLLAQFVGQIGGTLAVDPLRIDQYYFHLKKNRETIRQWAETLVHAFATEPGAK